MMSLIIADLRRILLKKSFLMAVAVTAVLALSFIIFDRLHFWNGFLYAINRGEFAGIGILLILGIAAFLGIYADEFQSKSLQAAIGRGLSRKKIILVKIIDCTVLTTLVYLFFLVFFILLGIVTGAHMNADDLKILTASVFAAAYNVICCTPLAAAFLFATGNAALAVFVDLVILVIIPFAFDMLSDNILLHNYHIASYYISGIANEFYSDTMLGGGGFLKMILGAAFYLGLAYLVTWLAFRKKELEL